MSHTRLSPKELRMLTPFLEEDHRPQRNTKPVNYRAMTGEDSDTNEAEEKSTTKSNKRKAAEESDWSGSESESKSEEKSDRLSNNKRKAQKPGVDDETESSNSANPHKKKFSHNKQKKSVVVKKETKRSRKPQKKRATGELTAVLQYLRRHSDPRIGLAFACPDKVTTSHVRSNSQYRITCEGNARFFTNQEPTQVLFATPREAENNCVLIWNPSNPYRKDDPEFEEKHLNTLRMFLQAAGSSYRRTPTDILAFTPQATPEEEAEAITAFNAHFSDTIPVKQKVKSEEIAKEEKTSASSFFEKLQASLTLPLLSSSSSSASSNANADTKVSLLDSTSHKKSGKAVYFRAEKKKKRIKFGLFKTLLTLRECPDQEQYRYAFIKQNNAAANNLRGNLNKRAFNKQYILTVPSHARCALVTSPSPAAFNAMLNNLGSYHQIDVASFKLKIVKATPREEAEIKKSYENRVEPIKAETESDAEDESLTTVADTTHPTSAPVKSEPTDFQPKSEAVKKEEIPSESNDTVVVPLSESDQAIVHEAILLALKDKDAEAMPHLERPSHDDSTREIIKTEKDDSFFSTAVNFGDTLLSMEELTDSSLFSAIPSTIADYSSLSSTARLKPTRHFGLSSNFFPTASRANTSPLDLNNWLSHRLTN